MVLMSPFSWQCQNLCLLSLAFILDWRVVHVTHCISEPTICERSRQFIFSKTHKTGSSTVQNILMRQVFHQNLSLVMPAKRTWLFPLLTQFSANANIVADYYNQTQKRANTFDAFLYHATWNYREMRRMVPKGPVITILRDPIDMFESGYSYFQRKPKVHSTTG